MNLGLVVFCLFLAFGAGFAFGIDQDECPELIRGYKCKQDFCNHCKNEVEKAKAEVEKRQPPTKFNFRP